MKKMLRIAALILAISSLLTVCAFADNSCTHSFTASPDGAIIYCTKCGTVSYGAVSAAPTAIADSENGLRSEHAAKMADQNPDLEIPDAMYFLDEPVRKTIVGSKGACIYKRSAATDSKDCIIGKISNGTEVNVLAQKNGYALFVTDGGEYAWGANSLIVNSDDTAYLMAGKGSGTTMYINSAHGVYVLFNPYGVFGHLGTMKNGVEVTAYNTINGFTYVDSGTMSGWVYAKYLTY